MHPKPRRAGLGFSNAADAARQLQPYEDVTKHSGLGHKPASPARGQRQQQQQVKQEPWSPNGPAKAHKDQPWSPSGPAEAVKQEPWSPSAHAAATDHQPETKAEEHAEDSMQAQAYAGLGFSKVTHQQLSSPNPHAQSAIPSTGPPASNGMQTPYSPSNDIQPEALTQQTAEHAQGAHPDTAFKELHAELLVTNERRGTERVCEVVTQQWPAHLPR